MRTHRKVFALIVILLISGVESSAQPCGFYVETSYFSDYFQTVVGEGITDCNGSYSTWGTLDGAYSRFTREACCSGDGIQRCFQKVNGEWVSIDCPE